MSATLVQTPIGILPHAEVHKKLEEAGLVANRETITRLDVEIEVYAPVPEDPGYVHVVHRKTPNEIWAEVKSILHHYVPDWEGRFHYIGPCGSEINNDRETPEFNRICCFVVTGCGGDHYLHVELMLPVGRFTIILGKTLQGAQAAWDVAIAISTILSA